jgi:SAM-dependent methyltransferase
MTRYVTPVPSSASESDLSEGIGEPCSDVLAPWESAYTRFETPEQEIRKFTRRLRWLGANTWLQDAAIAELFCAQGNGLEALTRLSFKDVEGVDLSAALLARYRGPARCRVADCRQLPFDDSSKDIVIIHGGLHHLEDLPFDLDRTLAEIHRVLRPEGTLVFVEPWLTPFLGVVHMACRMRSLRRLSRKIDALATMIEHERSTYDQWLSQPGEVLTLVHRYFDARRSTNCWGKLMFVGRRRDRAEMPVDWPSRALENGA